MEFTLLANRNAIAIPLLTDSSREADDSQKDSSSSYDNNTSCDSRAKDSQEDSSSSYDNNTSCDSRSKDSQEDSGSNSDANISDLGSSKNAGSSATPQSMHTPLEFSEEQVAIFTRTYEEGYDVFVDKHYVAWLEIIEKLPCQLSDVFSHVSPLEPVRQGSLSPTLCIDSQ